MASVQVKRRLGRLLEAARDRAGRTREDVDAAPGLVARTTLYRIETGKVGVKVGTVLALARFYGLPIEETDALVELAEASSGAGWVDDFPGVSEQLGWYADMEGSASQILAYDPEIIHGLLQTPDYARALMRLAPELSDVAIDERVNFRLERQRQILHKNSNAVTAFVLGETTLRMRVGGDDIMRAQLDHLKVLSRRISIVVRPFSSGPHRGSNNGGYAILDFADPDDPPVIYMETHAGSRMLEKPKRVAEFKTKFDSLKAESVPMEEFAT